MTMAMPARTTLEWAQEAQRQAFLAGPVPVCGSGGFGSSKTFGFILKALWLSDVFPGNRGLICRRVAKELRATTQATFRKICPPEAYDQGRWSENEGLTRLNNGSEILWMHMDDAEAMTVLRGLEINWFFFDQAEELDEEAFDVAMGRLGRWDKAQVPDWYKTQVEAKTGKPYPWVNPVTGRAIPPIYPMIAVNPDTELHWVYRRFHPDSDEWKQKWSKQGYRMIFFDTLANKFLPKQNVDQLLAHEDSFVRRYVHGEWGLPEGTIHHVPPESIVEFTDADQARETLEWIRRTCTLHRVLDHGDAAPTCCGWYAVTQAGDVICYREYYQPNKLVSYHRQAIADLSVDETYTFNLADPSIFNKTQQKKDRLHSVADEYADVTELPRSNALFWTAADNNELGTRNRINEYLRVDPERIHPITKQRGAPRLLFLKRSEAYPQGCSHILSETRSQKRVALGTDGGVPIFTDERDETIVDHGYDTVRYAIASRPPIGIEPKRKASPKSFLAAQQRLAAAYRQEMAVR